MVINQELGRSRRLKLGCVCSSYLIAGNPLLNDAFPYTEDILPSPLHWVDPSTQLSSGGMSGGAIQPIYDMGQAHSWSFKIWNNRCENQACIHNLQQHKESLQCSKHSSAMDWVSQDTPKGQNGLVCWEDLIGSEQADLEWEWLEYVLQTPHCVHSKIPFSPSPSNTICPLHCEPTFLM